jgi:hypothetical protein
VRIHNVKAGFSTNSSSSHSLLFFAPDHVPADDLVGVDGDSTYGWSDFTLASPDAKMGYLGAQIMQCLQASVGDVLAAQLASQIVGVPVAADGYVDHQSAWVLPMAWDGRGPNLAFLDELAAMLRQDGVVVVGGNDNIAAGEYDGHPLCGTGVPVNLALGTEGPGQLEHRPVARRDPSGYWTLYYRATGGRIRLSLDPTAQAGVPTKSAAPDLVDLKITDYCPFDCPMCYQDSTQAGRHADYDRTRRILWTLGDLRVFEVAIGGGEPTLHPKFAEIVDVAVMSHVVPNFTTKNVPYVSSSVGAAVIEKCGGFAVSVGRAEDVWQLAAHVTGAARQKLAVQHIVGMEAYRTASVIDACVDAKIPLTLLGYKYTGRGARHAKSLRHDPQPDAWITDVKCTMAGRGRDSKIAIDTVLADKFYDRLITEGVPKWCLTRKDGQFSAYVDAVTGRVHPSSYEDHPGVEFADATTFTAAYQGFAV